MELIDIDGIVEILNHSISRSTVRDRKVKARGFPNPFYSGKRKLWVKSEVINYFLGQRK